MSRPRPPARSRRAGLWARLLYRPSLRRLRTHPVLAELARLEHEQWLSPSEARSLQRSRLLQTVCEAAARVPFYREALAARNVDGAALRLPEDLHRLPVLTRADLASGAERLVADGPAPPGTRWNHTGGSSGTPVSFLQDSAYRVANLAAVARHDRWAGWEFGARTALLWGADQDLASAQPWRQRLDIRWFRRQVELDAFQMGPAEMERFRRALERFHPQVVRGYAGALDLFAAYLEEMGRPFPAPRGIISCAETLTEPMRQRLESVLAAPVHDRYGSREFGLIASECEQGRSHVNTRGVYVEILDGDRPATPGTVGRLVITGLANRVMPLLRYDTGDIAEATGEEACPCGRGLPLLGRVHGRASDFITAPDGRLIHGEFFTHLFYGRTGVRQFAVEQDEAGALTLLVAGEGPDLRRQVEEVVAAVQRRVGASVPITARRVERVEHAPSGKRCFVRSRMAAGRWSQGGVSRTGANP